MDKPNKEYQAALSFSLRNYSSAREIYEELLGSAASSEERKKYLFNISTCQAAHGDYNEALQTFQSMTCGDAIYNQALCMYRLKRYTEASDLLDGLLEACQPFNSLLVDGQVDSTRLEQSHLIEALNLKSATLKKLDHSNAKSQQIIDQVPIKDVSLLDCVTLHNQAIYECEIDPESAIDKLAYLYRMSESDETCVPIECYRNLLTLYINSGRYGEAKELMKSSGEHLIQSLTPEELIYLEVMSDSGDSDSDGVVFSKLNPLLDSKLKEVELLTDSDRQEALDFIETVATSLGASLWHKNRYKALEVLLLKVEPVLRRRDFWTKTMAHALYMQDNRFEECCQLYEDLLPKSASESLLRVDPFIVSNLCISYVLTSRNSDAELLIKDLEAHEAQIASEQNEFALQSTQNLIGLKGSTGIKQPSHLCIVNLAVGTLYCVKYNYEFGLSRIMKTFEPVDEHLGTQTWLYAKRCILSVLDNMCKQIIHLKDDLLDQLIGFLIQCERLGIQVETWDTPLEVNRLNKHQSANPEADILPEGCNSVTYEARYLRSILLTLIHD